jgi:hypothetical protein
MRHLLTDQWPDEDLVIFSSTIVKGRIESRITTIHRCHFKRLSTFIGISNGVLKILCLTYVSQYVTSQCSFPLKQFHQLSDCSRQNGELRHLRLLKRISSLIRNYTFQNSSEPDGVIPTGSAAPSQCNHFPSDNGDFHWAYKWIVSHHNVAKLFQ